MNYALSMMHFSVKFGPLRTFDLLCLEDSDGHSAMHWAAFIGDVNLIEYLIRRSLDPLKMDRIGRDALHMAAVGGKLDAFIFLVKCGCSMQLEDSQGKTPVYLAAAAGFTNIVSAANSRRLGRDLSALDRAQVRRGSRVGREGIIASPTSLVGIDGRAWDQAGEPDMDMDIDIESGLGVPGPGLDGAMAPSSSGATATAKAKGWRGTKHGNPSPAARQCAESKKKAISLYSSTASSLRKPHALRRLRQSRPVYAFIYAGIVTGYWCLALALPFYAWLVLAGLSLFLFR